MPSVIVMPEVVETAAQNLAGIRSSLAEVVASVAGPTTGLAPAAADEVSAAIASLFGNVGQNFQALSAQAQAFHAEFVDLLNQGAGAYLSAEVANAEQALTTAVGAPGGGLVSAANSLGGFLGGGATIGGSLANGFTGGGNIIGGLTGGLGSLGGDVTSLLSGTVPGLGGLETSLTGSVGTLLPGLVQAQLGAAPYFTGLVAPYQALFANTWHNLQSLGATMSANPFPFLHQLAANQAGYAHTIAAAAQTGIQNLPAEVAHLPATIRTGIHEFLAFNPAPYVHEFINQQIGYAQTVWNSLQSAGHDFVAGLAAMPADLQTAAQVYMSGDTTGGLLLAGGAMLDPFFSGFDVSLIPGTTVFAITPLGAVGDLLPIAAIPGQMAQNFTNFIPAGSIPAMMSQNATNLLTTVTDFSQTVNLNTGLLHVGLPLALALDAIGPVATTAQAMQASAGAFMSAVHAGDGLGAMAAMIDAPAVVANGFLNGHATLPLNFTVVIAPGIPPIASITSIPLGGILTPLDPAVLTVPGLGSVTLTGTTFGGLAPGLLSFLPQALAQAIGAPPIG